MWCENFQFYSRLPLNSWVILDELFLPYISFNSLWRIFSTFVLIASTVCIECMGKSKRKMASCRLHVCLTLPPNGILYYYSLLSLHFLGPVPLLFYFFKCRLVSSDTKFTSMELHCSKIGLVTEKCHVDLFIFNLDYDICGAEYHIQTAYILLLEVSNSFEVRVSLM